MTVARTQIKRGENPEINTTVLLLQTVDRLCAAVDAVESLCVAQGADSYVMVYALRRALARVADPDPHTTSDEETT
jgi:hypothetical protein